MPSKLAWGTILGVVSLAGCHSPKPEDPATAFSRIYADFLRGQLNYSRQAAAVEKTALLQHDPAWSYKFRLLEAEIFQFQGRSQDVANTLRQQGQSFYPTGDLAIKQQILLSLADARLGHQQQSIEELKTAQQLTEATPSMLEGEVLRTQGLLENRNGQQAAAEKSFRGSLAFARKHHDDYLEASDLLNLGRVALQDERVDEALDAFNASSRLAETIHADVILESDRGNAGWAYYTLGDFEGALQSFRQAQSQAQSVGATDSEILWLQGAGLSLSRLGELKQAQSCYEDALRAALVLADTGRRSEIEASLGALFLQRNDLPAANSHASEASKAAQQIGDNAGILDASFLQARIAARTSNTPETERMLTQLLEEAAKTPSILWGTEAALANLYAAKRAPIQADQWYRKSIQTFETQRHSVEDEEQRLPFFANGDELYRDYAEFLISERRSSEALQLLDIARAKTLKEGVGSRQASDRSPSQSSPLLQRSGRVQPRKPTILFYSLGPQTSYLWEIDSKGTHLFVLPPEPEIAVRIRSYQASILKSRDPLADANPDSLWLYENLVAPTGNSIPHEARVLVIPDGVLNGFNLETLLKPGPQGIHYWIEDVSLTTASSMQLFSESAQHHKPRERPGGKILLIGNPLPAGSDYSSLPNAAAEVENIQQHFPGPRQTTLTQAAAVPAAYVSSHPAQYEYLHFVAHGMASSLRPLDSAIILSPSSSNSDQFKLYARDIIRQPLHARLVTISACYGSGVRNYAGEGLVGLSWAFLRAGAHQVIGALWEVNDSSTPQLMDQLYRDMAQGEQPDQALRAAKLSMLHSPGVFRKPLYWAAFQLYTGS